MLTKANVPLNKVGVLMSAAVSLSAKCVKTFPPVRFHTKCAILKVVSLRDNFGSCYNALLLASECAVF